MPKLTYLLAIIFLTFSYSLSAQIIYVDPLKGDNAGQGTQQVPLATLEQAIERVSAFTGKGNITIKLMPGIYVLNDKISIDKNTTGSSAFIIEAAIMPDDTAWKPSKMPVVSSVSANNTITQFPHSVGFLVGTDRVTIRGLKFLGNANPETKYYYPITREDSTLTGLNISQCYFVGERNSAPIQGSIWAHGAGTHVDHCIFYGTKNALLLFKAIKDFSLTHSIIVGSYESAVWFGAFNSDFEFENNIVANCTYFWLRAENTFPKYKFSKSLFVGNTNLMGFYTKQGAVPAGKNAHIEDRIKTSGQLILSEVSTNGLPQDYLNPTTESIGKDLKAGIFKK